MSACFRLLMPIQHLYGAVISEVHSSFDSNLLSQENGLEGDPDINTNTREQGFEDVSQAQCIDGKAKGRVTTEVDIMRCGVDAVTDANADQLQVSKRDSKSASDPKSSKKGKENQEGLKSSKEPRLKKKSPWKRLLDVKAAITTLSRSSFASWAESKKCGNLWKRLETSTNPFNSNGILKLKRQISITIYKFIIDVKTRTFTSSLTSYNLDFSSRPWRLGWGVRTGRVTA